MKDDLKKNGIHPQKNEKKEDEPPTKMENNLTKKWKTTFTKKEDDLKKNLFSIPLKLRGKPFLGLAQLSKILSFLFMHILLSSSVPAFFSRLPPKKTESHPPTNQTCNFLIKAVISSSQNVCKYL